MKKYLYLAAAVLSLNLASCYNDDDVWDAINGQEERIAALEAWQKIANENITALQAIVNGNDYIKAVTPITENGDTIGYTISFLRQGDVTLYHGKEGAKGDKGDTGATGAQGAQGEKGDMPVIGVTKQSDGYWYWTLNGELLKDAEGNPICASGKDGADGDNGAPGGNGTPAPTPQIKTENGDVLLSVDGGVSWTKVNGDDGTNGDSYFSEGPKDNGSYWTFTLTDGTKIDVPKYTMLALSLKVGDKETPIYNAEVTVGKNQNFSIVCKAEMGCKWSYKVLEGPEKWSSGISKTAEGLQLPAITDDGSATILFTLTTESNQVFFYQVTIKTEETIVIEKTESSPELIEALQKAGFPTNGEGDIEITSEQIENTTALELTDANLTSLEGLECFSNVTTLICSNNKLGSIDASVFPKLTTLDCSNNNLTTLDVSELTNLEYLYCSNNELVDIDLSALKNLKVLDCANNLKQTELQTKSTTNRVLDLTSNPELEELTCTGNELTELNVTACEKLSILICNKNLLTKLDLSKNKNLRIFNCEHNHISPLDLSANINLENLCCYGNSLSSLDVSNNKALTYLHCNGNALVELDVTHLTKLEELYCAGNSLSKVDVSKNENLRLLECYNNQLLTALDVSHNKSLACLDVLGTNLTTLDVSKNSELVVLKCMNCMLPTLDISANTKLETLWAGSQRKGTLTLFLNEAQKEKWETSWKNDGNQNVALSNGAGTNSGADFGNGGVY